MAKTKAKTKGIRYWSVYGSTPGTGFWRKLGHTYSTKAGATAELKRHKAGGHYNNTLLKVRALKEKDLDFADRMWPPQANPADGALVGAKVLGVTRGKSGKVTGVTLQLRPGSRVARAGKAKVTKRTNPAQRREYWVGWKTNTARVGPVFTNRPDATAYLAQQKRADPGGMRGAVVKTRARAR